jgi:phosphoribosyl-AMP cyclohydrolase
MTGGPGMSQAGSAEPIRFGPDGLIPAVIQDSASDAVLMVGFMNEAALSATRETGRVHFWSRSRNELWRKGATSGHEQIVDSLHVNCDQNSLLVRVQQIGAVCHDGYDTCFYRRLADDNTLTVTRERSFDPATVYGQGPPANDPLTARSREHFQAFAYLRDTDLSTLSRTSALLRQPQADVSGRIADELRELAGVLDGSHRHGGFEADLLLEGSQVLYWVTVAALQARIAWADLRPDRALATHTDELPGETLSKLLHAEAAAWASETGSQPRTAPRYHATLALVGQAIHHGGITPEHLISADLAELLAKPYMAAYLANLRPAE